MGTARPIDREISVGRLLADPGRRSVVRGARVRIRGGVVAEVATGSGGGGGLIAMPALADAHDHGRGLSTVLSGAADQALETWLPALAGQPAVDPYAVAALALARLARGGFSSIAHFHVPQDYERMVDEAGAVARAAADVGVRVAFIVPLRDRNRLVLGDDDAFLSALPAAERDDVAKRWLWPLPPPERQVEAVEAIAQRHAGPMFDVQYGPVAPQWCSDRLLELIAEASARHGRRVHTHLLETRYQREWADAAHPEGFVTHLDALGLLTPRLTVAHGVWLRPDEIERLAQRGVTIAVNTGSNLRLRSGTAPVAAFVRAGVDLALGLDGMALDDDSDGLGEMRLMRLMHAGIGLDEALPAARLFEAALGHGHRVVGAQGQFGKVEPGHAADLLLLDFDRLAHGHVPGAAEESELVLARATAAHVEGLIVAGREVVAGGRALGVDEDALAAEVAAQAAAAAGRWAAFAPVLERFRARVRAFYRDGRHRTGGVRPS